MKPAAPPSPKLVPPFADRIEGLSEDTCDTLSDVALGASIFGTLNWYGHLASTSMLNGSVASYLVVDAGGPTCVPLIQRKADGMQRIEALSNFYSPQFEPVAHTSQIPALASTFARYAVTTSPAVDLVELRPLDTDSAFFAAAQAALRKAGFWVDSFFCFGNWYLELSGQRFDDYFLERPSQLRNTWRRNRKKLEQRGLRIDILRENSPALEAAIIDYESIYNSSWKHPEPFSEFIPGLVRMAAKQGWLRMGVLQLEGKAVAAQIWFVKDGVASIYKLAYIEEFAKQSVGTVLTHELMRSAIDEDRVHVVDYLSGDDAYKRDWMTHRRERRGIIAFNQRRPRAILAAARHFGGRWLKTVRGLSEPAAAMPLADLNPRSPVKT